MYVIALLQLAVDMNPGSYVNIPVSLCILPMSTAAGPTVPVTTGSSVDLLLPVSVRTTFEAIAANSFLRAHLTTGTRGEPRDTGRRYRIGASMMRPLNGTQYRMAGGRGASFDPGGSQGTKKKREV